MIVATSTLELGIDMGDLDRVIQIDAPGSVASFLQRIGRTGRRTGTLRNCLFLATSDNALLQATALVALWRRGFVEPIVAPRQPYHLFVQQLLALALQTGGLPADTWREWLGRLPIYREMPGDDIDELIRHLIDSEVLFSDGVLLSVGDEGERKFGRRHFLELVSVFTSPPLFEVVHGNSSIGMVDWLTVAVEEGREHRPLILAGRAWEIREIDFALRRIFVAPSAAEGRARWYGLGRGLSLELAQGVREVLLTDDVPEEWSRRCRERMEGLRDEYRVTGAGSAGLVHDVAEDRIVWWSFAGRFLNEAFSMVLDSEAGIESKADDYCLRFPGATDVSRVRDVIVSLLANPEAMEQLPISQQWIDGLKFSECLPPRYALAAARGRIRVNPQMLGLVQICSSRDKSTGPVLGR